MAAFRALVIGGSVGGLAAALELRRVAEADVRVYERSAGLMQARGAGVVMQPEVAELLAHRGLRVEEVSVHLEERVMLARDGTAQRQRAPQWMTAWDTLYTNLRVALEGSCYRQDSELVRLDSSDDAIAAHFADGYSARGDLVVAADGVNSQCRVQLVGDAEASYAGYVAWRGLEDERALPDEVVRELRGRFTFFYAPGMQCLCYLVPGADGATEEGRRRVNWVWYLNTAQAALDEVMTSSSGRRYRSFLPKGQVADDVADHVTALAQAALPPLLARLVCASDLFAQPVQDVAGLRRVHGRVLFVGDAAGTVRPHTAAGTSKAFGDARTLAHALHGWSAHDELPREALEAWGQARASDQRATAARGLRLASSSSLGVRGAPGHWRDSV